MNKIWSKYFLLEIRKATLLTFDWFWLNLITLSTLRRYQALRPLPTVLDVLLVLYKVWHIFPTILDFSYFSQPGLTLQRLGGKKEQSFYIYNLLLSKIPKMILRLLSCLLHSATLYKLKKNWSKSGISSKEIVCFNSNFKKIICYFDTFVIFCN